MSYEDVINDTINKNELGVKTGTFMKATVKARLNASLTYNPHLHVHQVRVDRIGVNLHEHPKEYFAKWYIAEDDFLKFCWVTHDICGNNVLDGPSLAQKWARVSAVSQKSRSDISGTSPNEYWIGDDNLCYDLSNSHYHGGDVSGLVNLVVDKFQLQLQNGSDVSFVELTTTDLSGMSLDGLSRFDYIRLDISNAPGIKDDEFYYVPVGESKYSDESEAFTWGRMDDGYVCYWEASGDQQKIGGSSSWNTNGNRDKYRSRMAQDARINLLYNAWEKLEKEYSGVHGHWPGWINLEKDIKDSCNNSITTWTHPPCQWKYETKRANYDQKADGNNVQKDVVNMDEAVFSGINVPQQEYVVNVELQGPASLAENANAALSENKNMFTSNYIYKQKSSGGTWQNGDCLPDDSSWKFTNLRQLNVQGINRFASVQLKLRMFGANTNKWQEASNKQYGKDTVHMYYHSGCKMIATSAVLDNPYSTISVAVSKPHDGAVDLIQIMSSAEDPDGSGCNYKGKTVYKNSVLDSSGSSTKGKMKGGLTKFGTVHYHQPMDNSTNYLNVAPAKMLWDLSYEELAKSSVGGNDDSWSEINIMSAFSDFTKMHNDGLRNFIKAFWTQPQVNMSKSQFTNYINTLISDEYADQAHQVRHTPDLRKLISSAFNKKNFKGIVGDTIITLNVPVQICGKNYKFNGFGAGDTSINEIRALTYTNETSNDVSSSRLGNVDNSGVTTYELTPVIELVSNINMMVWDKDQESSGVLYQKSEFQNVTLTSLNNNPVLKLYDCSGEFGSDASYAYRFASGIDADDFSLDDLSGSQQPFAVRKISDFSIRNAMGTRQLIFKAKNIDDLSINNAYIPGQDDFAADGTRVNPDVDFNNNNMCDLSGLNWFSDSSGVELSGNALLLNGPFNQDILGAGVTRVKGGRGKTTTDSSFTQTYKIHTDTNPDITKLESNGLATGLSGAGSP